MAEALDNAQARAIGVAARSLFAADVERDGTTLKLLARDGTVLGTADVGGGSYDELTDLPSIEGVELRGDKSFPELNLHIDADLDPATEYPASDDYALSVTEINDLWNLA